ncbi:4-oxalocrotonate tautomerase family protein [Burkholderia sp. Bp8990]|nr:4-oxalocrotonate tautomerase family protein [Burkholderia sp. Bp8990]
MAASPHTDFREPGERSLPAPEPTGLNPTRTHAMPHIIVKMAAGRSDATKQELAERLATAMSEVLALDASAVSVAVEDVPAQKWIQQVYGPDIEGSGQRLVKRPEYGPLAASAPGNEQ